VRSLIQIFAVAVLLITPAFVVAGQPLFQTTDVYVGGLDGVHTFRIPSLVTTKKGTLLAICDARYPSSEDPPNDIDQVVKRSTDLGRTWSRMQTIIGFPGMVAAGDPSVLADPVTGRVWLFYAYCPEGIGSHNSQPGFTGKTIQTHLVYSDDDGITWSKPTDITPQTKPKNWMTTWPGPGRGIRTRDGALVVPFNGQEKSQVWTSHVIVSRDNGKTWKLSPPAGHGTSETQMVELNDGSWLMNMRNERSDYKSGVRQIAVSRDGGQTWSKQRGDEMLVEPACQASILRYTSTKDGASKNRILFSNPARGRVDERWDMSILISYDEGKTWPVFKNVHHNRSAYSCLTILPDGTIGLLFEKGEKGSGNGRYMERLSFVRCNLEWLTDGKDSLDKP
jgi:sialidase-1